jgi:molybdate transport system ATP-binding protein
MTATVEIRKRLSPQFTADLAFDAPPGFTILFGASGSGKTTVLRSIAGLTRPDSGRIVVGGRVLFDSVSGTDLPPQRRRIGYVFQQLALFPHLTARANIAYGLHGVAGAEVRRRVEAIAESFRITDVLDRKPAHISGGERQRTALARALVSDPSMLLLDEPQPLSALDHAIQSRIMDDLRRWHDRHRIPVLYVTHNHREVYALGERVIVLEQGRILQAGSPHDVLDQPAQRLLASLAGFENVFDATVRERHERAGTMRCQVERSTTDIEVPLTGHQVGDRISVAIRAGDILLSLHEPHGISARNVLHGRVREVSRQGPTVVATIDAGVPFVVHVTPGGADALVLQPDARPWLIIKTYSCRILAGGLEWTDTMPLLTVRAAAQRLGVGYSTLKHWIYLGKVRTTSTAGGHHRIAEAEIDRLTAQTTAGARTRRPRTPPRGLIVALSGRNRLRGFVDEVRIDGLLAQVRLRVGDQTLTAVITADAVNELKLQRGDDAVAIIKSTEVMIAREVGESRPARTRRSR